MEENTDQNRIKKNNQKSHKHNAKTSTREVAFFCCFRQGVAGMSRDLGRDVPDLENFVQENFGLIFLGRHVCRMKLPPKNF